MPAYAYRCPQGHDLELTARMGLAPRAVPCPRPGCGGEAVRAYLPIHTKRPSRTIDSEDAITRFQHRELG